MFSRDRLIEMISVCTTHTHTHTHTHTVHVVWRRSTSIHYNNAIMYDTVTYMYILHSVHVQCIYMYVLWSLLCLYSTLCACLFIFSCIPSLTHTLPFTHLYPHSTIILCIHPLLPTLYHMHSPTSAHTLPFTHLYPHSTICIHPPLPTLYHSPASTYTTIH